MTILLLDRGYPSRYLFSVLQTKAIHSIVRISVNRVPVEAVSTKPQERYGGDTRDAVFMQPAKDKRSLLKMGFVHPTVKVLDSVAFTIPAGATKNISESRQKWNDNLLTKRINDTDVIYTFRKEDLIGVQIPISHVDPTKLFKLLDTLGFKRIGPAIGPRQVFANKQANIQYEMFLVTGQAIFTDQIFKGDGTGKAQ